MASNFRLNYINLPISIRKMILVASVVCVFFVLKSYANHLINQYNFEFSWILTFSKIAITYFLWVILTPLAYFLTKLLQNKKDQIIKKGLLFLMGCLLLSLLHQLIASRIDDFVNYLNSGYFKSFFGRNNLVVLVIGSFTSFIELLVIIAIFLGVDYQRKYLINQKALIAAQLNALRMQLHPHFLFNTLHSIASMIDIDAVNAQKMLSKLGTLLRSMLEYDADQMVTVKEELSFIKNYLDLEQIRYQDRVTINYEVSEEALKLKIPNMILQPLIENAVKYGVIPSLNHGHIVIKIQLDSTINATMSVLVLEITNSCELENTNVHKPAGTGFGHVNIRKRLQQFYQNNFEFSTGFSTPDLYISKITVPLKSLT